MPEVLSTARGRRLRDVLKAEGTVFLYTDRPKPVNNVFIFSAFFFLKMNKCSSFREYLVRKTSCSPSSFCHRCMFMFAFQDPQDFGRAYDPPEVITEGEVRLVYKTKVACDPHKPDKQKEIHLTFICSYGSLVSTALCNTLVAFHYSKG